MTSHRYRKPGHNMSSVFNKSGTRWTARAMSREARQLAGHLDTPERGQMAVRLFNHGLAEVRKTEDIPLWRRFSHLAAGAICAVYFSPYTIHYFELTDTEWQYLVPFGIGAFWWKAFEAFEAAAEYYHPVEKVLFPQHTCRNYLPAGHWRYLANQYLCALMRMALSVASSWEKFSPVAYRATPAEQHLTWGYGHYGPDVPAGGRLPKARPCFCLTAIWLRPWLPLMRVRTRPDARPVRRRVRPVFNAGAGVIAATTGTGQALRSGDTAALRAKLALFINQTVSLCLVCAVALPVGCAVRRQELAGSGKDWTRFN
ncbi:hypothetical protein GH714_044137 [Hevea brasiliensis]|uniref:Uncharacterized protein n=1 Tax=Hevea brasiliensis TaxID=3981 RepID=A0A6A6K1U3_HEVBR|nr:hypothetical protein GH714_044137 [Hevea brasiliensis]